MLNQQVKQMRYAIVINLDYSAHHNTECSALWAQIRQRMMDEDFRVEGRIFTTELPEQTACEVARGIIDALHQERESLGADVYSYLKEFYGYDHSSAVNLLLPPCDQIEIDEA